MFKRTLVVGGLLALMVGPLAMAQQAPQTTPAGQTEALTATMRDLRQSALRLTLLNALPEEARADASALLDRVQALRTSEQELEVARLQAYVAALETGESPTVARELAAGKVATQSADVTRTQEALRADLAAFVAAHPEVRGSLLQASSLGRGPGGMLGAAELGGGHGMRFGAGGFGMQRQGQRQGGAQGNQAPEWLKRFTAPGQNSRMR